MARLAISIGFWSALGWHKIGFEFAQRLAQAALIAAPGAIDVGRD